MKWQITPNEMTLMLEGPIFLFHDVGGRLLQIQLMMKGNVWKGVPVCHTLVPAVLGSFPSHSGETSNGHR